METTSSFNTKTNLVKDFLIENKTITSWQAINLFKATRLSAIIFNLKDRGMIIETEMIYDGRTRYGIYKYLGNTSDLPKSK